MGWQRKEEGQNHFSYAGMAELVDALEKVWASLLKISSYFF